MVIHMVTRRPAHKHADPHGVLVWFLWRGTKSMWIGVLCTNLQVAMWITHVGGKFRHDLPEKSLILGKLPLWADLSFLIHGPLDICLHLLSTAPLPPVQRQNTQHKFCNRKSLEIKEKSNSRSKKHSPAHERTILAWNLHSRFEFFILAWKSQSRALFFCGQRGARNEKDILDQGCLSRLIFSSPGPSGAGTFWKKFWKNSGKTMETLSELFLQLPKAPKLQGIRT